MEKLALAMLLLLVFVVSCSEKTIKYVCPDGTVADSLSECPAGEEAAEAEETAGEEPAEDDAAGEEPAEDDAAGEEPAEEEALEDSCVVSGTSGLQCRRFSIESSEEVSITLYSLMYDDEIITGLNITLTNQAGGGVCTNPEEAEIEPVDSAEVALKCSPALSKRVDAELYITYDVYGFRDRKSTTGTLTGMVPE